MAQFDSSFHRNILAWMSLVCLALVITWLFGSEQPGLSLTDAKQRPSVGQEVKTETALIRKLKQAGDWDKLVEVLDASMVAIPAGEFVRGSNTGRWDEKPEGAVYLDAFEIDRYEVTNIQYQRFLQASASIDFRILQFYK